MADEAPTSYPSLRQTKTSTWVGYGFLFTVDSVMPGYRSSIGLPWWWVCGTLGVTFVLAIISFIGYFSCKRRGERIGVIYLICPALLVIAVIFLLNFYNIVRAILRYGGAA